MPITSKHILISRQDNIGDVILTLPMAARLKQLNPGVRITMLCRAYAAEVVRYCTDIDNVVEIERIENDLTGYLKRSDIDTVILAQPDRALAIAAFRAGIRHRIGNARQKVYQLIYCNRRVRFSKGLSENHEAQINFEFLRPYGENHIPDRTEIPSFYHFSIPADAASTEHLKPYAFNLVLHTKSNGHGREWPIESYLELAQLLASRPEVHVWLTGSKGEGEWLNENASDLVRLPNVTNISGTQTLAQLTSFINQADGLIASGTGPLHLSAAIGQRTLGLFPPTRPMHPGRWAAIGRRASNLCLAESGCDGCSRRDKMTCDCMRLITPAAVLEVVESWIADKSPTVAQ
ncbi:MULTISPECIES: glycosyltransferase family 9 protein [unclassified Herbaspirillum]|jgi:ADP-heptose:LPS heptosyltransferase|uniref:glycosyltransferase family 9 protein n=1 Tax=unclassified Herbaspirillum TaxID=2624150 RepID=UPI000E2FB99A|nr:MULTISPECIES: glycosyltransferase family 9 protein [unclassified Herbaspirillum]RFB65726.1 glycosyltransferase family 9 protein [Herbaspirillum sp. 3R-3a1]TFI08971.1 glycosyltransferase family 9 protein [Herbaspirillum sp. 3R11]TFI15389.1 glycosyltransferase family 9 protein [Herbaspirillum sp. 3R-11]TFI31842.1 glycosyltransferase family 9 protein [Herbaspirillum sp. 3C11]